MFARLFLITLLSSSSVAADAAQPARRHRHRHHDPKARSGAHDLGRKISKPFRHIGGHLEKFFTGHDTISR